MVKTRQQAGIEHVLWSMYRITTSRLECPRRENMVTPGGRSTAAEERGGMPAGRMAATALTIAFHRTPRAGKPFPHWQILQSNWSPEHGLATVLFNLDPSRLSPHLDACPGKSCWFPVVPSPSFYGARQGTFHGAFLLRLAGRSQLAADSKVITILHERPISGS